MITTTALGFIEYVDECVDVLEITKGILCATFKNCKIKQIKGTARNIKISDSEIGEFIIPRITQDQEPGDYITSVEIHRSVLQKFSSQRRSVSITMYKTTVMDLFIFQSRNVMLHSCVLTGDIEQAIISLLRDLNLENLGLHCCDFYGAEIADVVGIEDIEVVDSKWLLPVCPTDGSFVAWKKAHVTNARAWEGVAVIKLLVPEDALRSSGTTRKCRVSKATVLGIYNLETKEAIDKAYSLHDPDFVYTVGAVVEPHYYNPDRWKDCAGGIHCYISEKEAREHW